jgi:glycosyltransferase involved in cell wall biosynthesis
MIISRPYEGERHPMARPPLVSILIPAYNKEQWIAETIESALAQTWKNTEIIIVDDGSRDNTLKIAKRFQSTILKVSTQENQGACSARNNAYSLAQGSYIQWLDADDILDPYKIEAQMTGTPDGSKSACLKTAPFGSFYFAKQRARFCPNGLWQDSLPAEWMITKFQEEDAWINPTAWLVSRKLTEIAGAWDSRLTSSGADDGEYICRLVSRTPIVEFCREAKCYYRIGNLSSLNHNSEKALDSLFLAVVLCIEHLLSIEDSPRTRQASLRYLQRWHGSFYSGSPDLHGRVKEFALTLGGSVVEPEFTWKFEPIRRLFGWNAAAILSSYLRNRRMLAERTFDQIYEAVQRHTRLRR